jgi:hypothetical protein
MPKGVNRARLWGELRRRFQPPGNHFLLKADGDIIIQQARSVSFICR